MSIKVYFNSSYAILGDALINTSRLRYCSGILKLVVTGYGASTTDAKNHCFSTKQLSEVLLTTKVW